MLSLTSKQQEGLLEIARLAREGAKLRPQAYRSFFKDGGSCFIGAVAEARSKNNGAVLVAEILWYNLLNEYDLSIVKAGLLRIPFPENNMGLDEGSIFNVASVMNDKLGYTREQIADYLEKLANETEVVDADTTDN